MPLFYLPQPAPVVVHCQRATPPKMLPSRPVDLRGKRYQGATLATPTEARLYLCKGKKWVLETRIPFSSDANPLIIRAK